MSRDDVLLVVQKERRYYIFHANASYDLDNPENLIQPDSKFTYSRSKALVLAHDKQKKLDTEYGVREFKVLEKYI
jgi:hypothetical protein